MPFCRVKINDPGGRWRMGELGAVVASIGTGYDVWLDFGTVILPAGATLFGRPIRCVARVFGFMADEVEPVSEADSPPDGA